MRKRHSFCLSQILYFGWKWQPGTCTELQHPTSCYKKQTFLLDLKIPHTATKCLLNSPHFALCSPRRSQQEGKSQTRRHWHFWFFKENKNPVSFFSWQNQNETERMFSCHCRSPLTCMPLWIPDLAHSQPQKTRYFLNIQSKSVISFLVRRNCWTHDRGLCDPTLPYLTPNMYLHVDDSISTHHTPSLTASLWHNHFWFSASFCFFFIPWVTPPSPHHLCAV